MFSDYNLLKLCVLYGSLGEKPFFGVCCHDKIVQKYKYKSEIPWENDVQVQIQIQKSHIEEQPV